MPDQNRRQIQAIIGTRNPFKAWPVWAQNELAQTAVLRNYQSGKEILPAGMQPQDAIFIVKGALCYHVLDEQGKVRIFPHPAGHDEIINLAPMLKSFLLPAGLQTQRQTTLLHIPRDGLMAILAKAPELMEPILTLLCQRIMLLAQHSMRLSDRNSPRKLANVLLALSKRDGVIHQEPPHIHVSQDQLAAMLGLSRQSINKALGKLVREKVIVKSYGGLHITNMEALRNISRERPTIPGIDGLTPTAY